jgi:hypothetical protein
MPDAEIDDALLPREEEVAPTRFLYFDEEVLPHDVAGLAGPVRNDSS